MRPAATLCLTLPVLFLTIALLTIAPARAQGEFDRGFIPYQSYHSTEFDSINLYNGSLTLHIPLLTYPQRGTLPPVSVFILSNSWTWYEIQHTNPNGFPPTYQWAAAQVLAWNGLQTAWNGTPVIRTNLDVSSVSYRLSNENGTYNAYHLVDASGASHIMGWTSPNTMVSIDGSGLSSPTVSGVLAPSGWTDASGNGFGGWKDPIGNDITLTNGSYTDSIGRSIPYIVPSTSPGCTTSNYPGPNGGTIPLVLCYGTYSFISNFQMSGIKEGTAGGIVLQSVTLPNGTSWSFAYDSWGDIASVTVPTGGTISYTWTNVYSCAQSSIGYTYSRAVATRTVDAHDGNPAQTWTYNYSNGTVTDPVGNDTAYTFSSLGGSACSTYETKIQYYSGSHLGPGLLKTVETQYSSNGINPFWYIDGDTAVVGVVPTLKKTTWPNGQVSQETYVYDNAGGATFYDENRGGTPGTFPLTWGRILQKNEYDYGNGGVGSLLRQTNAQYLWQTKANYLEAVSKLGAKPEF